MKKVIICALFFVVSATCVFAQFSQQPKEFTHEEQSMLKLSHDKWHWMADKNVVELKELFHENAVFVHMGGYWGTEQELMIIESGGIHYKYAEILGEDVRFAGNTVIINSTIRMTTVLGGNEIVNPFFVTEIYLQDGSRWKMISLVFTTRIEMQKQYDGDQK